MTAVDQETLDALFESIGRYAADGRLLFWNRRFEAFYAPLQIKAGMRFEEIVRGTADIRAAQGAVPNAEAYVAQRLAYRRSGGDPVWRRGTDGRRHVYQEVPTADGGWIEKRADVTDDETLGSLAASAELLTTVLDSLRAEVIVYDARDRAVLWNRVFLEKFRSEVGRDPEHGAKMGVFLRQRLEGLGRMSAEEIEATVASRMQFHRARKDTFPFMDDGRDYILRETHAPNGFTVLTIVDVTELRETERRNRALSQSNVELQRFARIASHDLQEPLRIITSFVQLLREDYGEKLDETAFEFIDFIVDAAGRMSDLIRDLLAYTRVETHEARRQPTPLGAIVGSTLQDLRQSISEADATIVYGDLPTLLADATHLKLLMRNLIGNAVNYRGDAPLKVVVSAERDDEAWRIAVADNGIGIDPKHSEEVFQIFRRLHDRSQRQGTGVGLAICQQIVEQNGGRIWVESRPDEGATFYFTWPLRPDADDA